MSESNKQVSDRILAMIRRKFPEYHPLMSIAELAHDSEDERLQFDCHKALARFIEPELKSVEVKATVEDRRRVVVTLFDGDGGPPAESFTTIEGEATKDVTIALPPAPLAILVDNDPMWENLESINEAIAA